MKLSSLIYEELIYWEVEVNDYKDVYSLVAKGFEEKTKISRKTIEDAFHERDKLGYTVSKNGFSIPHGRIEGFNDVILSIVKLKNPVKMNGQDVHFFFVLLTSKSGANLYLKTLAAIAKLIQVYGDEIKELKYTKDFIRFIDEKSIKLSEPVRVSEIMKKDPVTIKPEMTIREVVDIMKKTNIQFFPVVDDENTYLGKIDLIDILHIAYPEYILMINVLSFLTNFRAYEEFENKEKSFFIKDLFIPKEKENKTIYEDATIIELGFLIVKNRWHHVTVIDRNNKVVGVISDKDMVNKILRA